MTPFYSIKPSSSINKSFKMTPKVSESIWTLWIYLKQVSIIESNLDSSSSCSLMGKKYDLSVLLFYTLMILLTLRYEWPTPFLTEPLNDCDIWVTL